MRGIYCVYGASLLSIMAAILLIFVNISQLSQGPVTSGLYLAQLDVTNFGGPYTAASGGPDGVYAGGDGTQPLGQEQGLKQFYRYGVYDACGYNWGAAGACNATMFGYPFQPLGQMMADISNSIGKKSAVPQLLGNDSPLVVNVNYNYAISRAGGLLIFVGSAFCGLNIIFGFFKMRLTYLIAAILCGLSALTLMIGAAMWTAVIARNATINTKMFNNDTSMGITITAGSALYVTWAAFVFQALATIPYVITGLTYSRKSFEYE